MTQPMDYVEYLSREIGARPAGTEEEQQAALYIADEFQKEAGFPAAIEEFTSTSNLEGYRAILSMVTIVVSVLAMLFNVLTFPAFLLAVISAVIYALEVFDHPVISRALARGASQNVVAKYQPQARSESGDKNPGARVRKIVLLAHYDTGKVTPKVVKAAEGTKLPFGAICLGGMVAAAFFLLLRIFVGGTGGAGLIFINILTILAIIIVALPIVKAILYRTAPYNEGANNNATGVATLLEVARRISQGSVSEADLADAENVVLHGEQALLDSGLVPEGAQLDYEAQPIDFEPGEDATEEERLLAAKAAIAALTGQPIEQRVYYTESSADEQPEDETAAYAGEGAGATEIAEEGQPVEDFVDTDVSAASMLAASYTPAPALSPEETGGFENAPSWFVSAQRNAKRSGTGGPVQRSRYTEAISAAEQSLAERDRKRAEEERLRREAEYREIEAARHSALSGSDDDAGAEWAMEAKPEPEPVFAPIDIESFGAEAPQIELEPMNVPLAGETPDLAADREDEDAFGKEDPDKTVAFIPEHLRAAFDAKPRSATEADGVLGGLEAAAAAAEAQAREEAAFEIDEDLVSRVNAALDADIAEARADVSIPLYEKDAIAIGADGLAYVEGAHEDAESVELEAAAEETAAEAVAAEDLVLEDETEAAVAADASDDPAAAAAVDVPNVLDIPEVVDAPAASAAADDADPNATIAMSAAAVAAAAAEAAEAIAEGAAEPGSASRGRLGDLPTIDGGAADDSETTVPENTNPSRSGLFRMLRTDVPSLSGLIDPVGTETGAEPSSEPAQEPRPRARLTKNDLPSLSGLIDPVSASADDAPASAAAPRTRTRPPMRTVEVPEAGAAARADVDYSMEIPLSGELAQAADAEAGEKGSGEASAGAHASSRWQGGAFSRVRLGHVNMRSGEEEDDENPEELVETVEDEELNEEIEQIYHFRNPLYDAEIWFVAIGSDTELHDGARAFINEHKQELRGAMFVEIESLGQGELAYTTEEGGVRKLTASSRIKRFTRDASEKTGIVLGKTSTRLDSVTTTIQKLGFQVMHLMGVEDGQPALKGSADDIFENVDELILEENINYIMELLKQS